MNLHPNPNTELHFTLHSPLTLNLYDDQGRHTGISTTTGELEEDIPESRYMRFGEVQFISVPTSLNTRLVMNGYAEGSFTLDAEEVQGEVVVASTTFAGIPSTSSAIAVMDIPSAASQTPVRLLSMKMAMEKSTSHSRQNRAPQSPSTSRRR